MFFNYFLRRIYFQQDILSTFYWRDESLLFFSYSKNLIYIFFFFEFVLKAKVITKMRDTWKFNERPVVFPSLISYLSTQMVLKTICVYSPFHSETGRHTYCIYVRTYVPTIVRWSSEISNDDHFNYLVSLFPLINSVCDVMNNKLSMFSYSALITIHYKY